ncbi:MAG: hypothetical protein R2697_13500 [Ilumatobacteraceae bacterium]
MSTNHASWRSRSNGSGCAMLSEAPTPVVSSSTTAADTGPTGVGSLGEVGIVAPFMG